MHNYVEQAIKTESIELSSFDHPRFLHAGIGVNTEVAELLLGDERTNFKEELGDILWYCAIMANAFGCTFDQLASLADEDVIEGDPLRGLLEAASNALDHLKKVCFYGVDVDEAVLGHSFGSIIYAVQILGKDEDWSLSELQQTNIGKLRKRYGEKFTVEAAVNRDTAAEMEAVGT